MRLQIANDYCFYKKSLQFSSKKSLKLTWLLVWGWCVRQSTLQYPTINFVFFFSYFALFGGQHSSQLQTNQSLVNYIKSVSNSSFLPMFYWNLSKLYAHNTSCVFHLHLHEWPTIIINITDSNLPLLNVNQYTDYSGWYWAINWL